MSQNIQRILFSDYFGIKKSMVEDYGAFNVSLLADLPLFIDPFLIFQSSKVEYQNLHDDIIKYISFLQSKSMSGDVNEGLLQHWYRFPEVRQTWLGFSISGNSGSGLGKDFARELNEGFKVFSTQTQIQITKSDHIEKFCLIREGVGKDNISDFVTNLIKEFLLQYTQSFAQKFLAPSQRRIFNILKVRFDYKTERWQSDEWELPCWEDDYVVLVPRDLLTRKETWINKGDLISSFERIVPSLPDEQLRALVNNYFEKVLPKEATDAQKRSAIRSTIDSFPQLIDYYIKEKEESGEEAVRQSDRRVQAARSLFLENFPHLASIVAEKTSFYDHGLLSLEDTLERVDCLKQAIEVEGGHQFLRDDLGNPIVVEGELKIAYRFLWFNSQNNPDAKKIFAKDVVAVDFKLASTKAIENNLRRKDVEAVEQEQDEEKKASIKPRVVVVFAFSPEQKRLVEECIRELRSKSRHIRVIGAFAQSQIQMETTSQAQTPITAQATPGDPSQISSEKNPTAFISYTHDVSDWQNKGQDPETQRKRVLALCQKLRDEGVDCIIDQLIPNPPQGWPRWMEDNIEQADFVIVVATETYNRRFKGHEEPGKGLGGQWEGAFITQDIYESGGKNSKFVPIVFGHEDAQHIPRPLRSATHYDVSNLKENDDSGLDGLYFYLTGQPLHEPNKLGSIRKRAKP